MINSSDYSYHITMIVQLKNLHWLNSLNCTFRIPRSASILPAANVAPPAKKLEWWNIPFFFWEVDMLLVA